MKTGLVLGRFLPPHLGHQYLIDFAQNYVDELLLIVGTRHTDAIAGEFRFKDGKCDYDDIEKIARGHRASEQALARQATRILFSDTGLLTTTIWSNVLFGTCPTWISEAADAMSYDLYLVTDIDVPYRYRQLRVAPADGLLLH